MLFQIIWGVQINQCGRPSLTVELRLSGEKKFQLWAAAAAVLGGSACPSWQPVLQSWGLYRGCVRQFFAIYLYMPPIGSIFSG